MARVGCMGRRSPGRSGGRAPGAPAGRGRWKMGWPGTGRPGAGRPCMPGRVAMGCPGTGGRGGACGLGGAAVYTGRGPVCGVITRREGGGGAGFVGAAATGGAGAAGSEITGVSATGSSSSTWISGWAGKGATARGGSGSDGATRGGSMGGGGVGGAAGRAGATGVAATGTGASAGAAGLATAGGGVATGSGAAGGFTAAGGTPGLGGTAAGGGVGRLRGRAGSGCCCWVMALSTSPGREIFERSNLVLISGSAGPRALRRSEGAEALFCAAKNSLTRSASSTSMELEWVFFSVTPTLGRTSRMAFDLTSSSLARSLIRIFGCIRPAIPPICPVRSS